MDKAKNLIDGVAFLKGLTSNTFALVALGLLGPVAVLTGQLTVSDWIGFAVLCVHVVACLLGAVVVAWRDHVLKASKKYDASGGTETPEPPVST